MIRVLAILALVIVLTAMLLSPGALSAPCREGHVAVWTPLIQWSCVYGYRVTRQ